MDEIFQLMYYVGFTHTEAKRLPVWERRWYIERTIEEFKNSGGDRNKSAHDNTPDARAMQGMNRAQAPAKLRRFT